MEAADRAAGLHGIFKPCALVFSNVDGEIAAHFASSALSTVLCGGSKGVSGAWVAFEGRMCWNGIFSNLSLWWFVCCLWFPPPPQ